MIKVAKYIRVSTEKQAQSGDSLREQDQTLSDYVDSQEDMICVGTYIDDGISGQKISRGEFQRLVDDVISQKIDLIIFTKLDRWFRSLRHYLNTQEILEKNGVNWFAVSQPYYNTTTAVGRAFIQQSMTWAELEAQNDSERILSVFANKVKNGEVISGTAPFGYKIEDKHLVPSEDAEKVVKIFEHFYLTSSLREVMRYAANEFGIVRAHSSFRRMMQNRKYIGEFRDNKNYCPPIVSKDLFDRCNALLSKNQRANKYHDYVFSMLIVCGDCGRKMSAATFKRRRKNSEGFTESATYRCQGKNNGRGCCNTKVFFETTLELRLVREIKPLIRDYIAEYEKNTAKTVDVSSKISSIEKKLNRLKELYLNELITLDEYKRDKERFSNEISALSSIPADPKVKDISLYTKLLDLNFDDFYWDMGKNEKNFFWRSFVDYIELDNDKNMFVHFL